MGIIPDLHLKNASLQKRKYWEENQLEERLDRKTSYRAIAIIPMKEMMNVYNEVVTKYMHVNVPDSIEEF